MIVLNQGCFIVIEPTITSGKRKLNESLPVVLTPEDIMDSNQREEASRHPEKACKRLKEVNSRSGGVHPSTSPSLGPERRGSEPEVLILKGVSAASSVKVLSEVHPTVHSQSTGTAPLCSSYRSAFQGWKNATPKLYKYRPSDIQVVFYRKNGQVDKVRSNSKDKPQFEQSELPSEVKHNSEEPDTGRGSSSESENVTVTNPCVTVTNATSSLPEAHLNLSSSFEDSSTNQTCESESGESMQEGGVFQIELKPDKDDLSMHLEAISATLFTLPNKVETLKPGPTSLPLLSHNCRFTFGSRLSRLPMLKLNETDSRSLAGCTIVPTNDSSNVDVPCAHSESHKEATPPQNNFVSVETQTWIYETNSQGTQAGQLEHSIPCSSVETQTTDEYEAVTITLEFGCQVSPVSDCQQTQTEWHTKSCESQTFSPQIAEETQTQSEFPTCNNVGSQTFVLVCTSSNQTDPETTDPLPIKSNEDNEVENCDLDPSQPCNLTCNEPAEEMIPEPEVESCKVSPPIVSDVGMQTEGSFSEMVLEEAKKFNEIRLQGILAEIEKNSLGVVLLDESGEEAKDDTTIQSTVDDVINEFKLAMMEDEAEHSYLSNIVQDLADQSLSMNLEHGSLLSNLEWESGESLEFDVTKSA